LPEACRSFWKGRAFSFFNPPPFAPNGEWPIFPRGTGFQFHHNFNSRGAALFAFFFSAKGAGLDLTLARHTGRADQ
jgi:hypothetical protein